MVKLISKIITFFLKLKTRIVLKFHGIKFGKDVLVRGKIIFRGKGKVVLGNDVIINSSVKSNVTAGDRTCILVKKGAALSIGDGARISNARIVATDSVEIGQRVFIGAGAKIFDTDFHPICYKERVENKNELAAHRPVEIKDGAFIGAETIILKGVTVGVHSVIGAGSVVTKDVPDFEIWAGNPAKKIKDVSEDESL